MMSAMKRKLIYNEIDLESKKVKTDDSLQYDYINYIYVPSLESMAVVSIATALCKQSDIRDKLRQLSLEFDLIEEKTLCRKTISFYISINEIEVILNKLSCLPLPKQLKAIVSNTIRPIGLQILAWLCYDRSDVQYIDSICWTNQGTIDKIKTLKQLILEDTGQHIHSLFKLACMCCLEESIPDLWGKLPKETKDDYLRGKRIYKDYDSHLMAYWASTVNNELSGLFAKLKRSDPKNIYKSNHSVYKNMLTLALLEGNILAVQYFWNKLTDEEIYNSLEQWINHAAEKRNGYSDYYQYTNGHADILYFLLSKVNDKEQQKHILQQNIEVVLISMFADWPWQRLFLPTIQEMWEFIDEKMYVNLLTRIIKEVPESKTTEKLFRRLWCSSPMNLKRSFIQYILSDRSGTDVLCNLLKMEDFGIIKGILNDTNIEEQKNIIFALIRNEDSLFEVLYEDKFCLFGDLLMEVLSESDFNIVKERVVNMHGNWLCCDWLCHSDWNMFEKFVDWAFTSQDQIDNFKSEIIDKIYITHSLLEKGDYQLVDKFLDWCFASEQEINRFKKHFAKSKPQLVELGIKEWCLFKNFVDWCFDSEQEMNDFKLIVLRSCKLRKAIYVSIMYAYNFEFIDKILSWCCRSDEEIKQYKAEFVFSDEWFELLQQFVCQVYDSGCVYWQLIQKFLKLFSPFEVDRITDLKKAIENKIRFDDFRPDNNHRFYRIEKEHLFLLLDTVYCNMKIALMVTLTVMRITIYLIQEKIQQ